MEMETFFLLQNTPLNVDEALLNWHTGMMQDQVYDTSLLKMLLHKYHNQQHSFGTALFLRVFGFYGP